MGEATAGAGAGGSRDIIDLYICCVAGAGCTGGIGAGGAGEDVANVLFLYWFNIAAEVTG